MEINEIKRLIGDNNSAYLKEISDKLFSKHAAIMIGAGFSKNAIPNSPYTNTFSDWNELGDIFFEKLNGKKPDKNDRYLNVLRLANEIEAAFGRPVLDSILRQSIPDLNYSPSELHKKLLNLPWEDVFTTNYDTLLERTAETLIDYKYSIVHNKDDLVGSSKPRIIKLHGSFPSERPFIITEEDYRKYPHDFAPFVNTVQQSLLENTLCLIGFSGTDPNFLQWIGWIRDNLNKNVTKIYLIGVFSFSDAQIKLFAQRNIVVVNLDTGMTLQNKHYEALNLFIDYLQQQKKNDDPYNWPESTGYDTMIFHHSDPNLYSEEVFINALDSWEHQRITYPGWVVLPENKRNSFKYDTEEGIEQIIKYNEKLDKEFLFRFFFELLWRIDISLIAIPVELATIIEKNILSDENKTKDLSFFFLMLLRCYRHSGDKESWNRINKLFETHIEEYTQEIVLQHKYELALNAIFELDYNSIRKILSEWTINPAFPFMNAKKAGILSEIGNIIEAESILRQSLIDIRKLQNYNTNKLDWTLLSQESYIISLYQNITFTYPVRKNTEINYKEVQDKYSDRILFLKDKLCDPNHEEQAFKLLLSEKYVPTPLREEKYQFEINKKTYIRHFGFDYKPLKNSIAFLLYSEKISQPFCINSGIRLNISISEAIGAGERLCDHYLNWAVNICCRLADVNLTEKVFSRERLASFDSEYINALTKMLLNVLEKDENYILQEEPDEQVNFSKTLATIIPEIISRLCCRCSRSIKKDIFLFVKKVYTSNNRRSYHHLDILLNRLMESFSVSEKLTLFSDFIEIKIPSTIFPVEENKLLPMINFVDLNKNDVKEKYNNTFSYKILEPYYDASISTNAAIRFWGIETLAFLFEFDLLDESQKEKFNEVLWKQVDSATGLPANTNYNIFSFLNLPHPENTDVEKIIKQYLLNYSLPTYNSGIRIHSSFDTVINNFNAIIYSENFLSWEYKDFCIILKKMYSFWQNGKKYIEKDSLFGDSEILHRYIVMEYALSAICRGLSNIKEEEKNTLKSFIDEFSEANVPCLELQSACFFTEENRESILFKINFAFSSDDDNVVLDGLRAFETILKCQEEEKEYYEVVKMLWNNFTTMIIYKRDATLVTCLNYLGNLYIPKYFELIPATVYKNILFSLQTLAKETDIRDGNKSLETALKLTIRRNCACVAYKLYKCFSNKSKEIPLEINTWEKICSSDNEFAEICNEWRE